MKICSVIGARPQFVKLAPLSREIRTRFDEVIVHTGQHYDRAMSDQFWTDLDIPTPDYNLGIRSGTHGQQTGAMLAAIEEVFVAEAPDSVVVFGDTNTTLAAAIAAAKLRIHIVHVEAGLRSFNRDMPEEINRVLTDHGSDLLFAPTKTAMQHLEREGLSDRAVLTGDIMVDALQSAVSKVRQRGIRNEHVNGEQYSVLTLHRPYNVDAPERLSSILSSVASANTGTLVFPCHPRTQKVLQENRISVKGTVKLVPPQGYLDFVSLLLNCEKVITDSGGLQKEAFILGKPCITLRPETEWVETVEEGWNTLADPLADDFPDLISSFSPSTTSRNEIFGSGVAERMADSLEEHLTATRKQIVD